MIDFKKRIKENDNRCTAFPYLLLLQVKRTYVAHPEYHHNGEEVWVEQYSGDYVRAESKEALMEEIRQWYDEGEEIDWEKYRIEKFYEGYYWETINVFLTDEGYQEHLKINAHNLGEHRTFGIHAFRNREMNEIYKMLT